MRILYIAEEEITQLPLDNCIISYQELPNSLTAFVSRTAIRDYEHIVFNLIDTVYSNEHIVSAIQILRQFSAAEITLIKEKTPDIHIFFSTLQSFNIRNLIALEDESRLIAELVDCISGKKKLDYLAQTKARGLHARAIKQTSPEVIIPKDTILNIAIVGMLPRIGATTHAIGIYHFLKHIGFKPIVIDKCSFCQPYSNSEQEYGDVVISDFLYIKGIPFDLNEHCNSQAVNANIIDLGNTISTNIDDILSADLLVAIGGTKLNEVLQMVSALKKLEMIEDERIVNIISFSTREDVEEISKSLRGITVGAPYKPDIWGKDNEFYSSFLREKIRTILQEEGSNV